MKTSTMIPETAKWFVVAAKGQHLGRLATQLAHALRGKHKPSWSPHQVHSDHIVVVNAGDIVLTGDKEQKKVYYRHSGFLGHLKKIPVSRVLKEKPEQVIIRAVKGMLPRNRLRTDMMKHLHVYAGTEHKHEAQKPEPFPF